MPELPDLTIYQQNLRKLLARETVIDVTVYRAKRLNVEAKFLRQAIMGASLTDIEREGKELVFCFDSGHRLSVHLMLNGRFDVTEDIANVSHKCLSLEFKRLGSLIISDPRAWATFTLDPAPYSVPDALGAEFDVSYLRKMLQSVKAPTMKAFLIDQEVVRGIGNAYADEILYESRISPLSSPSKLPEKAILDLFSSIRSVLSNAIESISSAAPDAINGEHRDFLKVHNPNKTHSPHGFPIHQEEVSTKNTYFTDEQILY